MIPSQFYPTVDTLYGNILLTNTVINITEFTGDDPLKPYYMGYVDGNDFPEMFEFNTWTISGSTVKVEHPFKENHPWAYATWRGGPTYRAGEALVNDGNGNWVKANKITGSHSANWGLINGGHLASSTMCDQIRLELFLFDLDANTLDRIYYDTTFEMVENFIYNDAQFDIVSSIYGNISIKYSQFNEYGVATISNVNIMFCGWDATNATRSCGEGAASTTIRIAPIFRSTVGDTEKYMYITPDGTFSYGGSERTSTTRNEFRIDSATLKPLAVDYLPVEQDGFYFGMPSQDIDFSNLTSSPCFLDRRYYVKYEGPISIVKFSMLIEELYKFICMWNKVTKNNAAIPPLTTTYTTVHKVSLFDENNKPLFERISGNYEDIKDKLQPWQYPENDVTLNDFDVDDMPPYEPPSPDDDKNTESGDKIPNQFGRTVGVTSNFVTNYLMTEGQISKLGEVLWTSWADDTVTMDMVDNFYGKFHDATGSWNVSDALQFIVSCRLFPCSLATRVNTTQVTSIPIGTGAFALQCGTSSEPHFFIANEATAIMNCGEIYVPITYNDYRDFENTKITAYLPFCGSVELNPQDVVGKWLGCTYAIDLFDGSCKAFIYTLSGDDVGYEGAYYNVAIKQGQCGFLIPLSATQAGQVASRQKVDGYTDGALLFNAGMAVLGGAMEMGGAMGGSASPIYGGGVESTSGKLPVGAALRTIGAIGNYGFQSEILSAQRMGRPGIAAPYLSGGSGFTDFHQPASAYIQIRRSYYQEPIEYEHSAGYPVNAQRYGNLSQFSGFITCSNVDLSGFTCHEDERSEIKALLESGVYL